MALQLLPVSVNGNSPGRFLFRTSTVPQSLDRKNGFNAQPVDGERRQVFRNVPSPLSARTVGQLRNTAKADGIIPDTDI